MRLALTLLLAAFILGLLLIASSFGATNYFTGSIHYSQCEKSFVVAWSNVPPNVEFQSSRDLTNWYPMLKVLSSGTNNWESLSYRVTDTNTTFMRLRQLP